MPAAERLSDEGFFELDLRTQGPSSPPPERRDSGRAERWVARTRHLLETDPGGCWVAEDETGLVGFATVVRRDTIWCLATYAVRPGLQGRGIGRPLLDAAMQHGRGCLRGMLSASTDPKAVRRYQQAGFALHPQMHLAGTVDRSAIPVVEKVREGSAADIDLMDSVDRQRRGAAHGPDHEFLLRHLAAAGVRHHHRLAATPTSATGRRSSSLLAATNRRTATRLLWAALADSPPESRSRSPTSRRPTSGRSTSAWRPGWTCTRTATWRCAG